MTVFAGATKVAETRQLKDMSAGELRALCRERGIEVTSRTGKAKMLELLGA